MKEIMRNGKTTESNLNFTAMNNNGLQMIYCSKRFKKKMCTYIKKANLKGTEGVNMLSNTLRVIQVNLIQG